MLVTIAIVSYRARHFLEQTLLSALEALAGAGGDGEIIVVDNNSADGTIEHVAPRFEGKVAFILNSSNQGFAKANNQAIAAARGEFTLILNPDTIIGSGTLREAVEWMRSHPECGAAGVRMIDGDGAFLPESKRGFPTPWVSFCKIFGLSRIFPMSPTFARYHMRYLDERQPHQVDILAGAFILARTRLLRQLGGFDEDFFMYGEDVDLSYRMARAGSQNWYLPITIIHYKGESTRKDSTRYVRVFYQAMLIFFRKHYPGYSAAYSAMIHLAVYASAAAAIIKRAAAWPFRRARRRAGRKLWRIISTDPAPIAALLGQQAEMCALSPTDVVIDDRCHTYQQIIDTIDSMADGRRRFHVYSGRNQILISPKMTQA